jgi:Beta-lactamase
LDHSIDRIAAETGFSGVVRVDRGDDVEFVNAYGLAHRGFEIANTVGTRFGIASGARGLTTLTVVSLLEEGRLELGTTARSVLRNDLPLIDDTVTVARAHRVVTRGGVAIHRFRQWHPSNEKCPGSLSGNDWHQPLSSRAPTIRASSTPSCVMSIAAPSWCQDSPAGAHRSGHPSGLPQIDRHARRCSAQDR